MYHINCNTTYKTLDFQIVIDKKFDEWKQKREEVKKRDKYLCQACINEYEGAPFMLNYKDL